MSILPKPKRVRLRVGSQKVEPAHRLRVRGEQDYARIDADTREFVWKRDGGKCRYCGATENLQFDHIIPRSRGGAGSAANVELLCAACNNNKKARLVTPRSLD